MMCLLLQVCLRPRHLPLLHSPLGTKWVVGLAAVGRGLLQHMQPVHFLAATAPSHQSAKTLRMLRAPCSLGMSWPDVHPATNQPRSVHAP
jgi:hypothetical protein